MILAVSSLGLLTACAQPGDVELESAFPHLSFERPLDIQHPGDGTNRLFVVEQPGTIRVFENDPEAAASSVFLDLTERVDDSKLEMGLLGLAFHPDYETNGFFYVNYTMGDPLRTIIARYEVDPSDPNRALPQSETILFDIAQPYQTHNGGQLQFGPDGYLYIALGDGASGGDPHENAQNLSTLLGSLLRIDVDTSSEGRAYGIPEDNPFVGADCGPAGCREEIFAYGFRNPWRFSFDPETGKIWLGDVAQEGWEEVDVVEKGGNYGWDILEATHCYEPPSDCDTTGLISPVWEFAHRSGNSITGGHVYRGAAVPELQGKYVFGGWGTGQIWTLPAGDPTAGAVELLDTRYRITTFGVDADGELYLAHATNASGEIYRLASSGDTSVEDELPSEAARLQPARPNPFRGAAVLGYTLRQAAHVSLAVYDIQGRRIRTLVDAFEAAGPREVRWDGLTSDGMRAAAGVYVARLLIDGVPVSSEKLVRLPD